MQLTVGTRRPGVRPFTPGSPSRTWSSRRGGSRPAGGPAVLRAFGATIGERAFVRHRARVLWPWKLTVGDDSWIGECGGSRRHTFGAPHGGHLTPVPTTGPGTGRAGADRHRAVAGFGSEPTQGPPPWCGRALARQATSTSPSDAVVVLELRRHVPTGTRPVSGQQHADGEEGCAQHADREADGKEPDQRPAGGDVLVGAADPTVRVVATDRQAAGQ